MSSTREAKKRAAIASVKLVKSGQIVGLGTGSTSNYMIEELGRRIHEEKLRIIAIPTSNQTADLAAKNSISLTTLRENPSVDIAIDGADQVDLKLNLIKGMGGALTREKIVDRVARTLIIIVDESKITSQLGINQVVPIEVIPFATSFVMGELIKLGGKPTIRLSRCNRSRFVTDNGNNIIDVDFGVIYNVKRLEREIKMLSGVVESGLFVDMAKIVIVGEKNRIKKIVKEGY